MIRRLFVTSIFSVMTAAVAAPVYATCIGDKLAPLTITATEKSVAVEGGTAGGRMLVIGYGRSWDPQRYTSQFERYRAFHATDHLGTVTFERSRPFAADTLWTAVDVQSGRCGTTTAPVDRGERRHKALTKDNIRPSNGQLRKIAADLELAYVIVVRPGAGIWELPVGDGGPEDEDQMPDGKITLDVERLQPLGDSGAPPDRIAKGDVVLVFAPHSAAASFGRVEE